jgi:hypothetical protein
MTSFVRCLGYLLLALAVASCQLPVASAQTLTPKVRYSLAVYQPNTTSRVTSVQVGQPFDLALFVQDLRPAGEYISWDGSTQPLKRGVFAAYAKVQFNTAAIQVGAVNWTSSIYVNGKQFVPSSTGIAAVGAFDGFSEIGTELLEVCRVRCTAQWPDGVASGVTQISRSLGLSFATLPHPQCDTLVLGNWGANPPEQSDVALAEIVASGLTITVVK